MGALDLSEQIYKIADNKSQNPIKKGNVFPNYIYDGRAQSRRANMGFCHTSGHKQPPWHDSRSHHQHVITSFRISWGWGWWWRILTQDQDVNVSKSMVLKRKIGFLMSQKQKTNIQMIWTRTWCTGPFISFAHVTLVKVTSEDMAVILDKYFRKH